MAWSSPTAPTPLEVYPSLAFDQLFRDAAQQGTVVTRMSGRARQAASEVERLFTELLSSREAWIDENASDLLRRGA